MSTFQENSCEIALLVGSGTYESPTTVLVMVFLDFTGTDTTFVVVNLSSILLVTTVVASALVSLSGTETFVLYCNVTACLILLVNVKRFPLMVKSEVLQPDAVNWSIEDGN